MEKRENEEISNVVKDKGKAFERMMPVESENVEKMKNLFVYMSRELNYGIKEVLKYEK
jgi:hypothetical protein